VASGNLDLAQSDLLGKHRRRQFGLTRELLTLRQAQKGLHSPRSYPVTWSQQILL
jgi:hypothetical protein